MTLKTWSAAGAVAAALAAGPALAHHSFSLFNEQKTLTLEGTVKEFQWTNPHAWVQVVVKNSIGKEEEWSIEGASANAMARQGWSSKALKPGDHITVVIHPLKDGTNGGSLVSASVNGQPVGNKS
jgi:hypothetical protein